MAFIKHFGTYSSNGIETTPNANYVISFTNPINSLVFNAKSNLNIKINNETNYHYIEAQDTLQIDDLRINKIEIKETGVSYIYHAMYF